MHCLPLAGECKIRFVLISSWVWMHIVLVIRQFPNIQCLPPSPLPLMISGVSELGGITSERLFEITKGQI